MADKQELMVTGDLHLGRHPSRTGETIDQTVSPRTVWDRIVDQSIRRDVDAVILTGDIVDRANQFHEGWGPFENGLTDLEAEDIPTYIVSGNHDAGFLESFVDSMDVSTVYLIGRDGSWQRRTLEVDGEKRLHLDGWSYPTEHVPSNPLDDYDLPDTDVPTLGLLHTQVDAPGNRYAPTEQDQLKRAPTDGWLLGHVHASQVLSENPFILYPGSPQPLDPGETGVHGPWLITVTPDASVESQLLSLSTLEYVSVTVDAQDVEDPQQVIGKAKDQLQQTIDDRPHGTNHLDLISMRVTLTGRVEAYEEFMNDNPLPEGTEFRHEQTEVVIDTVNNQVKPALDLKELSQGSSPVAYLAELIQSIESGDIGDDEAALLERCRERYKDGIHSTAYQPLLEHEHETADIEESSLRNWVAEQGRNLLYELHAQKDDA